MKLYEYQGRELFRRVGIPVVEGGLASSPEEAEEVARSLASQVVVKAQVLVGGRGKAGGIKLAATPEEAKAHAAAILGMTIKGEPVRKVLVAEAVEIARELYLGVTIDRSRKMPVMIFSTEGGVEIEEVARSKPEAIHRLWVHPLEGLHPYQVRKVLFQAGVERVLRTANLGQLQGLFHKLYEAFVRYQANLAEINPLACTPQGELVALDSKFIIDDDALPYLDLSDELPGWQEEGQAGGASGGEDPLEREARAAGLHYVKLDGEIGIIGNGAGLVMATLDLVASLGGRPANFLDVGGGASAEQIQKAVEIVLSDPQVRGLYVNIFGGITRCDEVARGLVEAKERLAIGVGKPLVVRLTGTNEQEGREILRRGGLVPVAEMEEGAQRIVELVRQMSQSRSQFQS